MREIVKKTVLEWRFILRPGRDEIMVGSDGEIGILVKNWPNIQSSEELVLEQVLELRLERNVKEKVEES